MKELVLRRFMVKDFLSLLNLWYCGSVILCFHFYCIFGKFLQQKKIKKKEGMPVL